MARIEKTVFISYRRTDVYTALAVYENLKNQGYDIFFDYRSIASGDFEQVISSNIRARAHFLLILTPTALDRCNEPGDWLRREIELAIDEKRNIVPLFFKGFRFGASSKSGVSKWLPFGKPDVLTGKLGNLTRYNGLNVHEDYFDEAMVRVRTEYLSKPLDTVLHPVSTEVQKVVEEEQSAADEALKQKENAEEPVKPIEEKPDKQAELEKLKSQAIRLELKGEFWDVLQIYYKIKKLDPTLPHVDVKIQELEEELKPKSVAPEVARSAPASPAPQKDFQWQSMAKVAGIVSLLLLFIWGGSSVYGNLSNSPSQMTQLPVSTASATAEPENTKTATPTKTNTPTPTSIPPTPTLGVGSSMTGSDGMTLLYVPAGEFIMGSDADAALVECQKYRSDCQRDWFIAEEPPHIVKLNAFWIDQTEVTNAMFVEFLYELTNQVEGGATWLDAKAENVRIHFNGDGWIIDGGYENHPVTEVTWYGANVYCAWVHRRLPTEAEWEKAARGMNGNIYPWGDDLANNNQVNYNSALNGTTEAGKYPTGASPYGALNMAGNVWEWVADWYDAYPGNTVSDSDYGTTYRVLRGGSWGSTGNDIRSAARVKSNPTYTTISIGFRCAMDAE